MTNVMALSTTVSKTEATANILFVDDEIFILRSLQRLFSSTRHDPPYRVFVASGGKEALEIVSKNQIHVVVCDQRMPEMIGVDVLAKIKEASPSTMRILLTGYSDMSALVGSINEGEIFRYILKPWNNSQLKEIVDYAVNIALESLAEHQGSAPELEETGKILNKIAIPSVVYDPVDILVVDDDKSLYEIIKKSYDTSGRIHYANSIEKAFSVLEAQSSIGVLMTDVRVNHQVTIEMVAALKLHYPFIVTIVMTPLADSELLKQMINQCQIFRFFIKPPSPPVLLGAIQMALDKHNLLKTSASEAKRYQIDATQLDMESTMFKKASSLGSRLKAKLLQFLKW